MMTLASLFCTLKRLSRAAASFPETVEIAWEHHDMPRQSAERKRKFHKVFPR
jgi:hypothetical protein